MGLLVDNRSWTSHRQGLFLSLRSLYSMTLGMHSQSDYWAAVKNELLGRCNKRKDCLNCLNIFIPILGPVLRLIEELTEEEEVFGHQVQVQE